MARGHLRRALLLLLRSFLAQLDIHTIIQFGAAVEQEVQVGLRASSGTLATSPLSFVRPVLRRLVGRSTVAVPNFALQNVDRLIFLPPLSKMEPHAAIGDEREREDRVARDRKLAEIASKYVVRKMFGFILTPSPLVRTWI